MSDRFENPITARRRAEEQRDRGKTIRSRDPAEDLTAALRNVDKVKDATANGEGEIQQRPLGILRRRRSPRALSYKFRPFRKPPYIGTTSKDVNGLWIGEGEWKEFSQSSPYLRKKKADEGSYLWDDIIQWTCENALDGTLLGESNLLRARARSTKWRKSYDFRVVHCAPP